MLDKFLEMAEKLRSPVSREIYNKYIEFRDKIDSFESYDVVKSLEHIKMAKNYSEDVLITFENGNGLANKACCDDKCSIF